MLTRAKTKILWICGLCLLSFQAYSQNEGISRRELTGSNLNSIQSAVVFLTIAPDSRAGGMGDVGVATDPDINSLHWNPAKYAFIEDDAGFSISYTPWLRNLVNDINLGYISGYKRLDRQQVIAASMLYFSLGEIIFTDEFGGIIRPFNPNEFAISAAYSRLFSERFSGGIAFRFIRSDLSGGISSGSSVETNPGIAYAADVSTYYVNDNMTYGDKDGELAFGLNISNIGTKISYSTDDEQEFIPINLRLGSSVKIELDDYNTMAFALDFNKLLVPTPPLYAVDEFGEPIFNENNDREILYGYDPDVSVPLGMLQSFYDAPGGFREEMRELMISVGAEYWYREQFAVRTGYFYEHELKGNRKYFTMGVGLKLNVFGLDFAYLVPATGGRNNPLANTIRFTLNFNFN